MKMLKSLIVLSLLSISAWTTAAPLSVANGKFMLNGAPFYGAGVNYHDAFTRYANNKWDSSWKTGLATLKSNNVPFIRINTIGFWSSDIQKNFIDNKPEFYLRLDAFMNECSKQNIGVILDVFWNWTAWTDLNGENVPSWGDTNSKTRKMMRAITTEMVTRYKNHPALWGWEFANETTAGMDLPDAVNNYQWLPRSPGLPARTKVDNYTAAMILNAITDFSRTVRTIDVTTPIFSGNDRPRYNAMHLPKSWDPDTPGQFGEILSRDNPRTDTMTLHLYPQNEFPAFGADPVTKTAQKGTWENMVSAALRRSTAKDSTGKLIDPRPVFLGEWGTSDKALGAAASKIRFNQMADFIMANRIQMSALWVFDLANQEGSYNITATNSRAYQLARIKAMNMTMKTWK